MKTLRFGIEVEVIGLNREGLARAIQSVLGGTISGDYRSHRVVDTRGRTWSVVPDGSLSSYDRSGEIVSPVLEYADIEELQRIVRAVRAAGGRADDTCGIHYAPAFVMRSTEANASRSWDKRAGLQRIIPEGDWNELRGCRFGGGDCQGAPDDRHAFPLPAYLS
jgi:hypothetical protein